jgi:2-(1,2-epoxy-1,2-dihydrophenyl)acetyl-CoA isomerase
MTEPVLIKDLQNHVLILRLNRPEKKNALSAELTSAIVESIEQAAVDDSVRVVGITGVGDTFCAGADLSPSRNRDERDSAADTIDRAVRLVTGIRVGCEKPVICGINGLAIGAGLSLAMCCDIRIASDNASFHPGYARVGTSPDCGLTWTLPQAIGHERAMRFLLEIEFVSAGDALAMGMVGQTVPADQFTDEFEGYCQKIASVAPIAARQTKMQVTRVGLPENLEQLVRDELRYTGKGLASDDGKEAVRAIFEKRQPKFTGA